MSIKLFSGHVFLGNFPDYWEAEAQARWHYYTLLGQAYQKRGVPRGFMIVMEKLD
jgi:hypothetical protein